MGPPARPMTGDVDPALGGDPRTERGSPPSPHGFVVASVKVSVLLYVPVRSASLEPIDCRNDSVTGSLLTGPA